MQSGTGLQPWVVQGKGLGVDNDLLSVRLIDVVVVPKLAQYARDLICVVLTLLRLSCEIATLRLASAVCLGDVSSSVFAT